MQCISQIFKIHTQYKNIEKFEETLFIYSLLYYIKSGIPAIRAPPHLPCQTNLFSNFKPTLFRLFLSFNCFLQIYYYLLISSKVINSMPYRPAIQYTRLPCFVPEKIPAVPANFGQYRPVPDVLAGTEKSFYFLFIFF